MGGKKYIKMFGSFIEPFNFALALYYALVVHDVLLDVLFRSL